MYSHMNNTHHIIFTDLLGLFLSWLMKKARVLIPVSSKFSGLQKKNLFENEESVIGYEASWTGVFMDTKK
jgi:hypothetical protein